jgi:hypothetical protein
MNLKRLKHPGTWLGVLGMLLLLVALDAMRPPQRQVTARLYLAGVRFYRADVHPFTAHYIRCRYSPTCSHYSEQAVERFGIARGLWLTAKRVASCTPAVPMGTYDPLPAS